jgi:hypothetical protein
MLATVCDSSCSSRRTNDADPDKQRAGLLGFALHSGPTFGIAGSVESPEARALSRATLSLSRAANSGAWVCTKELLNSSAVTGVTGILKRANNSRQAS